MGVVTVFIAVMEKGRLICKKYKGYRGWGLVITGKKDVFELLSQTQERGTQIRGVEWHRGAGGMPHCSIGVAHGRAARVGPAGGQRAKDGWAVAWGFGSRGLFSEQRCFASKVKCSDDWRQEEMTFGVCSLWPCSDLQLDFGSVDSTGFGLHHVRGSWGGGGRLRR
ncbi:hypothetical protein HJG60_011385 [Phyllostomus discolor]|uniref:Uncharacterized protein n=1 Tax=Phyllostomus discolor TaxID=89673 RepID=A0A834E1S6_9CHIR|nr:hypothetical protein HJG60_011385 [Phyllostomus discolor]